MTNRLRPLSTIEILDAAWLLLRRNWLSFYAASGLGTVPVALAVLIYYRWLGTVVEGTERSEFYVGVLIWAVAMGVGWAINNLARGAVTMLALADARGESMTLGTAWRRSGRQSLGVLFAGMVAFAACGFAGLAAVVPGILVMVTWWVGRPVALQEDRHFLGILRRSARLTSGYRLKAFALWVLFAGVALLLVWNLHLFVGFLVGTAADLLGIDTTGFSGYIRLGNRAYLTLLCSFVFVVLDPLKTAADAIFYLDLRIRREGADLHERLRGLRAGAAVLVLAALFASPVRAGSLQDYGGSIHSLRERIAAAKRPQQVPPSDIQGLRERIVQLPDGKKVTAKNDWLPPSSRAWKTPEEKQALLNRLDALERSVSGTAAPSVKATDTPPPAGAATGSEPDVKQRLNRVLSDRDLQPLAQRDELKELTKGIHFPKSTGWWDSFWKWLKDRLFKQPETPTPTLPSAPWKGGRVVMAVVLALLVLVLVALLVKWIIERPDSENEPATVAKSTAAHLEASATENALDHTVDEWERFAQQWLNRGDVRQAIRALYLATLVHLHRERRIDYNRALTNWVYVRHFRGEADQQATLRDLTRLFDDVWYGDRPCAEAQYRTFEKGVRSLGTPAPV